MNPEIKKRWVEALRSGEYEQGKHYLRAPEGDGWRYCCLGVLCDLHSQETTHAWEGRCYIDSVTGLDSAVYDWAEIPYFMAPEISALMRMNDNGVPFTSISDWIERYL